MTINFFLVDDLCTIMPYQELFINYVKQEGEGGLKYVKIA